LKNIVIAIDGFSSCGKSTMAKSLAKKLDFLYIDSGAMYRAVTLFCLRNNFIDKDKINEKALVSLLGTINIEFRKNPTDENNSTYLNGNNVEDEIRQLEVSNSVSLVSKIARVREKMVELQRNLARNNSVVMDGRDIGTVVFPDADLKIFMTASSSIRAKRRFDELRGKGMKISLDEIIKNIEERDYLDQNREISPLRKAKDALLLDNSHLNREQQLQWVIEQVNQTINN